MGLDAFTARLGLDQGRIVLEDNSTVFALGSIQAGHMADLDDGDEVFVSQTVDFDANPMDAILATGTFFVPADAAIAGLEWSLTLEVSGFAQQATARGIPGQTRPFAMTLGTQTITGVRTITVRLHLQTI